MLMRRYKGRHIDSISSGYWARDESDTDYAVAVGRKAGFENQSTFAIAIGDLAGETTQGINAIAVGSKAGQNTQGAFAIAIGERAGFNSQGVNGLAIGIKAGHSSQGESAIAIGDLAGQTTQGSKAIAIGINAGQTTQGPGAIAIGSTAGQTTQGSGAIAIDTSAGTANQPVNSIIVNASQEVIVNPKTLSLYVSPIRRTASNSNVLVYGKDKEVNLGFPRLPIYSTEAAATAALTLALNNNVTALNKSGYMYLNLSSTPIASFVGDGIKKVYTISSTINNETVIVTVDQVAATSYDIKIDPVTSTPSIVFDTAPAVGKVINVNKVSTDQMSINVYVNGTWRKLALTA